MLIKFLYKFRRKSRFKWPRMGKGEGGGGGVT